MEAKIAQKYLLELHQSNNQWLSELALAQDEIMTYENRLSEVDAANNTCRGFGRCRTFSKPIHPP